MPINNRGMLGLPVLPFGKFRSYQGDDVFVDLSFLDHAQNAVTPTTLTYQIDDITNAVNMVPQTSVSVTGSSQTVRIPGNLMVMTHEWQGSQYCQIEWVMTATDINTGLSFTKHRVDIIELCSIQTPFSGS